MLEVVSLDVKKMDSQALMLPLDIIRRGDKGLRADTPAIRLCVERRHTP
jgi:hypothetical protein